MKHNNATVVQDSATSKDFVPRRRSTPLDLSETGHIPHFPTENDEIFDDILLIGERERESIS